MASRQSKPPVATPWADRLHKDKTPQVKRLSFDFSGLKQGTTMLVPSPREIDDYVRQVPKGQSRSMLELRTDLARVHRADGTCPVSTAIFLKVVAEASFEAIGRGAKLAEVTPFWRVVDPDSPLAKKLSCGPAFIVAQRKREQPKKKQQA